MYPIQNKFLHLFAGPTLSGISLENGAEKEIIVHSPVRRGDIRKLTKENAPGIIAIVDGTFHAYPAVGHAEIMQAIKLGWAVWGLSSMGAIRAAEMHTLGMQGFGIVFQAYRDQGLSDDEVTLLHQDEPPYLGLSEPLIHIRFFISNLITREILSADSGKRIICLLKAMWYGNRTQAKLQEYLIKEGLSEERVVTLICELPRFQLKTQDLADFLSMKIWRTKDA